jgi:putative IMPACT (imprinted ancient) family translation regulator
MRYSDDGEPQGTSGQPTLNVLRSAEIFNVCCVITRYFGGTLLGTGGLVRAYSQAASLALKEAGVSKVSLWERVLIACPYALYERVKKELMLVDAVIDGTDFGAEITLEALIVKGGAEGLNKNCLI